MERRWWHEKSAYQVCPKSFFDSNGDGIGDVPGTIEMKDNFKIGDQLHFTFQGNVAHVFSKETDKNLEF